MQFGGLMGILWLVLFFVVVTLIIFAVMLIGGVLVALVSLPALQALSLVRRPFVTLAEKVSNSEIDSLRNRWFLGLYVFSVLTLGFALIAAGVFLAELVDTYAWLVPLGALDSVPVLTVVGIVVGGILYFARNVLTTRRFRLLGEWLAFVVYVGVLTVAAFIFVPALLFDFFGFLFSLLPF